MTPTPINMTDGSPGKEQFRRIITDFRNIHIIKAMEPLVEMRRAFTSSGGQFTHMKSYLLRCDRERRSVTYNPEGTPLGDLIESAIGAPGFNAGGVGSVTSDASLISLPWAFDGSDETIPLGSQLTFQSMNALVLLGAIDRAIVNWTRLESRFRTSLIYVKDSMRMYGSYVQILEYLKAFTGDLAQQLEREASREKVIAEFRMRLNAAPDLSGVWMPRRDALALLEILGEGLAGAEGGA